MVAGLIEKSMVTGGGIMESGKWIIENGFFNENSGMSVLLVGRASREPPAPQGGGIPMLLIR